MAMDVIALKAIKVVATVTTQEGLHLLILLVITLFW